MVNFSKLNLTLHISTTSKQPQQFNISLYVPIRISAPPQNYTQITTFYLNASNSKNLTMNVTIEYNCIYNPQVVPFAFENESWHQIYNAVLLPNPCRAEFTAPDKHLIGLFYRNTVTTTPTPTLQTTYLSTSESQQSPYYDAAGAAIVVIAIIVIAYFLRTRVLNTH